MKTKNTYKTVGVEKVTSAEIRAALGESSKVIVGADVAKAELVVAFADASGETVRRCSVKQATQLPVLFELLEELRRNGSLVEVALEPTGTYGDVLRHHLRTRGFAIYRVSPKHVSDAKEVFDGVASKHDAKDAGLIAWLHAQKRSEAWSVEDERRRRARAVVERRDLFADSLQRNVGRLEAKLARHWPEVGACLDTATSKMLLALLIEFSSPIDVTKNEPAARVLLSRHMHRDKMEAVLASARASIGVPAIEEEKRGLKALAEEMLRQRRAVEQIDEELRALAEGDEVATRIGEAIGPTTAMVFLSELGDPGSYASSRAYEKAAGLNLRERSSGKAKGPLHITKRGPGRLRKYLYLSVLRLLRNDRVVRAYFAKHAAKGAPSMVTIVAIMRKVARALWHIAKGAKFDATKLFDLRRLDLGSTASTPRDATTA